MRKISALLFLLILSLLLAACSPELIPAQVNTQPAAVETATTVSTTPPPTMIANLRKTPSPTTPASTLEPSMDIPQVKLAAKDLAEKLGIAEDTIQVNSVKSIDWPDASLGCPKKGVLYIQVITPGYNIYLETGGNEYNYHTDKGERVVLCEPQTQQTLPATIITPEIYITPG